MRLDVVGDKRLYLVTFDTGQIKRPRCRRYAETSCRGIFFALSRLKQGFVALVATTRAILRAFADRRMIEKYRGSLVKTTGDGMLATFDGPGRARYVVRWISRQRPRKSACPCGLASIPGRSKGGTGIAVHAAARVMALSRPGEVLVSRLVTDLVAGAGLKFSERGSHELKGLPGHWDLFAAST